MQDFIYEKVFIITWMPLKIEFRIKKHTWRKEKNILQYRSFQTDMEWRNLVNSNIAFFQSCIVIDRRRIILQKQLIESLNIKTSEVKDIH